MPTPPTGASFASKARAANSTWSPSLTVTSPGEIWTRATRASRCDCAACAPGDGLCAPVKRAPSLSPNPLELSQRAAPARHCAAMPEMTCGAAGA